MVLEEGEFERGLKCLNNKLPRLIKKAQDCYDKLDRVVSITKDVMEECIEDGMDEDHSVDLAHTQAILNYEAEAAQHQLILTKSYLTGALSKIEANDMGHAVVDLQIATCRVAVARARLSAVKHGAYDLAEEIGVYNLSAPEARDLCRELDTAIDPISSEISDISWHLFSLIRRAGDLYITITHEKAEQKRKEKGETKMKNTTTTKDALELKTILYDLRLDYGNLVFAFDNLKGSSSSQELNEAEKAMDALAGVITDVQDKVKVCFNTHLSEEN